ncbi:hypothetical protein EG831_05250, partial [bacterium]|nr:hypothetical protein [bacterium]
MRLYYAHIGSSFGPIFLMASDAGLFQLVLGEHELPLSFPSWEGRFGCEFVHDEDRFADIATDLAGYLVGKGLPFRIA